MNGLDLTPWIEESGGVYGIWQVVEIMVVIVSFISVFAIPVAFVITVGSSILAGKTDNYYGKRAMRLAGHPIGVDYRLSRQQHVNEHAR